MLPRWHFSRSQRVLCAEPHRREVVRPQALPFPWWQPLGGAGVSRDGVWECLGSGMWRGRCCWRRRGVVPLHYGRVRGRVLMNVNVAGA